MIWVHMELADFSFHNLIAWQITVDEITSEMIGVFGLFLLPVKGKKLNYILDERE